MEVLVKRLRGNKRKREAARSDSLAKCPLTGFAGSYMEGCHSPPWPEKPLYFELWPKNIKTLFLAIKQPRLALFYAATGAAIPT